jgi:glycosyltransferase involved in cell wall biosynthesis
VGIASEVINQQNGLIVPPGDKHALEDAMGKMLDRCREYDREQIRKSVKDRFDNDIIGEQLFHLYREVLTDKSSQGKNKW